MESVAIAHNRWVKGFIMSSIAYHVTIVHEYARKFIKVVHFRNNTYVFFFFQILMFDIIFFIRFADTGREKFNLNVQNSTSTLIKYEHIQWVNKTRQKFAHSCFVVFAFILWDNIGIL